MDKATSNRNYEFIELDFPIGTSIKQLIELYKIIDNLSKDLCRALQIFFANRGIKGAWDLIIENGVWKDNKELIREICNPRSLSHVEFKRFYNILKGFGQCCEDTSWKQRMELEQCPIQQERLDATQQILGEQD